MANEWHLKGTMIMKTTFWHIGSAALYALFILKTCAAPLDLGEALDAPGLIWTTGTNSWIGQTSVSHYDGDAAESGAIGDRQDSWFQTVLPGPGQVSFWWKVSSEPSFDYLELWVDGQMIKRISGIVDWTSETFSCGVGSHLIRWRYYKDGSLSLNQDRGWVDQVAFLRQAVLPELEIHPLPNGRMQLLWLDPITPDDGVYLIGTTDLVNWARVDLPVMRSGNTNVAELDATPRMSFYRTELQPLVVNVTAESGRDYPAITGLLPGTPAYSDRDYSYASLPPEVQGATYIVTANEDKFNASSTFLSFEVSQAVTVYVAYDDRYVNRPAWLGDFQDSGLDLLIGTTTHSLYRKTFPPGIVTLGGNYVAGEGNYGMYTVFITKAEVTFGGLSRTPLYLGSYLKVPVILDPGSGLTMDDLDFVVPAGGRGGTVSLSRDDDFDPAHPDIMLLAGYEPGDYELQAVERSTGLVRGTARFSVSTGWADDQEGPSRWVAGDFELPGVRGATWGGGSPTDPENLNVYPASGTRQIALLLVDTASQRFTPGEIATMTALWQDVAFNGRLHNGRLVSTAHYYREVSYNKFDVAGQVFGPVSLPGQWSDYFQDNGKYKANLWDACAVAGDPLINYSQFQSLVCVMKTPASKGVWSSADSIVAKTAEGDIALGTVAMPASGDPFWLSATLAHELGHNLKLGDIYHWSGHPPQIRERELWGMDLMAHQDYLPHLTLVHRMLLGWVDAAALKLYNFQAIGGSRDDIVTLHPAELANPPAGSYSGIEIRIAPNWNYYFEYRTAQPTQIGDQNLWWQLDSGNHPIPANDRVLGTDVTFAQNFEDAARRKPIMVLPNDVDGDGPILGPGQDYAEQDISEPNFPTDFSAEVVSIDGTKAEVRIRYGVDSQPDPSIRPWNPPVYQSPDIEVRNAKNQADPKWRNVPWVNHQNTLIAKVTNRGALNAPGVVVDFYVIDYTVNTSGTQPTRIGTDQQDVPAGQTVEFSTIWMPASTGHYCIEVRIRHYQTPGPNSKIEVTEYNNRAQSNYDYFNSEKASPPSRKMTIVKIQNPFNEPALAEVRVAKSTTPLFRTFLDHTWLKLQAGESRDLRVMFEYAYEEDPVWDPNLERYISLPDDVAINAVIWRIADEPVEEGTDLGGVSARIATGYSTRFNTFAFDPPTSVSGHIVRVKNSEPVSGGKVLLVLTAGGEEQYVEASVNGTGQFQATLPVVATPLSIQGHYLAPPGNADCVSQTVTYP